MSQSSSSRVALVVSAASSPFVLASSRMDPRRSSFILPLTVKGGVTFSVTLTSDFELGSVNVAQLAYPLSMNRDSLRNAVLDSLVLNPYQQAGQSEPGATPATPPSARAQPDGQPSNGPGQAAQEVRGRNGLEQFRIQRARTAGIGAGKKLRGESQSVPATPEMTEPVPANRFYVVLRSNDESPPSVYQSWKNCKNHVLAVDHNPPEPAACAVFHGFPSWTEVEEYCHGAGVPVPPRSGL